MANLKSSKKDIRRIAKKTAANKSTRTSLKTYVKKVREAISSGDGGAVQSAVTTVQKQIDKALKHGVIHKNQAARRKSRIMSQAAKAAKAAGGSPVVDADAALAAAATPADTAPKAATKATAPKAAAPKAAAPKAKKPKAE